MKHEVGPPAADSAPGLVSHARNRFMPKRATWIM